MEGKILFDLGIVLFLGFFAALLMKKIGQSVIIGYMVAGLLIGPNALGLVTDVHLLNTLSELGVVFLMFFLGLEFSIKKFRKVKNSVFFIGTYEVLLNLIIGFAVGTLIGFTVKQGLFLAGIIALSSSGVVAKLLFDMKRTASKESEVLMGVMVFEDFFAIVLLGILSSFAATNNIRLDAIALSIGKAILFYAVFILFGIFIINKVIDFLTRIDSQELFTAFMLGVILLIGALATKIGLASAAGAFLLGMIITSYDVEDRLHRTVSAFKDIFLIVFFISFGMLLNPKEIPQILWIIAIIVPITVLSEIFVTSSASFFSGFSAKSAVAIGTSMIARGEYSMIYATLGLSLKAIPNSIYQFTGLYVFIMTLIAPIAMKNSNRIKSGVSFVTPNFIQYGAKLVSYTLKPLLLPEEVGISGERSFKFLVVFPIYLTIVIAMFIVTNMLLLIPLAICGIASTIILRMLFSQKMKKLHEQLDYSAVHEGTYNKKHISRFVLDVFTAILGIVVLGAFFRSFGYLVLLSLMLVLGGYLLSASFLTYRASKAVK